MNFAGGYLPFNDDVPIEGKKGFDNTDTNDKGILFKADVEQVVQELSNRGIVQDWKQDIYESEIVLANSQGWVVYQLKDHKWSVIQQNTGVIYDSYFEIHHVSMLSDWLQTKCLYYNFSDTSNTLVYQVYDKDRLLERCYFNPCERRDCQEAEAALNDSVFTPQETVEGEFEELPVLFQSKIRLIPTKHFDPWDYIDIWLAEQQAYVPSIQWGRSNKPNFQPGERVAISINHLPRQKVRRMDYVT